MIDTMSRKTLRQSNIKDMFQEYYHYFHMCNTYIIN